jgi:tetratricopeptide (TPR) repeat protein
MDPEFKYRAFISYSHSNEKWARWLHRSLESYRVPKHIVGKQTTFGPIPERIAPVFRDRDELATSTNLGATLTLALEQSAFQIVICSRAAARSRWVNEEILAFKRLGREHRIFCLIVDGEPGASASEATADQECFPNALTYTMGEDGNLTTTRSEPIAADARPDKDSKQDVRLKLIAGMLGIGLDELKQREVQRRQRRLLALVSASIIGMAFTTGLAALAWIARNEADRQRVRAEAEAETARQTTRFMVDLFKVSDPGEALGNKITAREILDKGAARIESELDTQPAIQATLMDTMGTVYTSLGLYDAALPLVEKAVEKRRSLPPDANADVAGTLQHRGQLLMLKARYEDAEADLRQALAMQRGLGAQARPALAATLSDLADVLSRQGNSQSAEPLIKEALAIRRAQFGDTHQDIAESLEDLGLNHADRGDFPQAVTHLREALAMRRKLQGPVHPALAEAINNLAWALVEIGKTEEAASLYREALAMKRRLLGPIHPEIALGLTNVAGVLEVSGDLKAAEAAYREALAMDLKLLGEAHPEIATVLGNLAFVVYREGQVEAAIQLSREALAMRRRTLGADHPAVASSAASLAWWLTREGEYKEAAQLVEESLTTRRRVLGETHPDVAGSLTVKANLLLATRQFDDAKQVAEAARTILAPSLPPEHWRIAVAMNVEGAALVGLGKYKEAEPLLLNSNRRLAGAPIPGVEAESQQRLARLYTAWGEPQKAALYRSAK